MLRVKHSFMATDSEGNEVFVMAGDEISEISDAGPIEEPYQRRNESRYGPREYTEYRAIGWNVTVRFTPSHKLWTELVTVDAVKLLKALEG